MKENKCYLAIDLKSFYASVECRERNLNPLTANLVVADPERTEKTICLAVSPSLKELGVPGRARLFEAISKVNHINEMRKRRLGKGEFVKRSYDSVELSLNLDYAVDFIVAPPRMSLYIEYSARIYEIYLKYVSKDDIHVYSIDEVFMDITPYLKCNNVSARDFARKILSEILEVTGITATCGIGTNLFLCKVAMDITAKHITPDKDGVRIAELDEAEFRKTLWDHRPLTDFWRVGNGYRKTLESHGMFTMGDIARCSIKGEDLLYGLFGVNAELLIDHAWGWEPCTIADIKKYRPATNSLSSGQVLQSPADSSRARLIVREMVDALALNLVEKGLVTNQIVVVIGYDSNNLKDRELSSEFVGEITTDYYGRSVPKHSRGSKKLDEYTSSSRILIDSAMNMFDEVVNKKLFVRRINITFNDIVEENNVSKRTKVVQLDLFTNYDVKEAEYKKYRSAMDRENKKQKTIIDIKNKYGKNAILKGMNLEEGATAKERNEQIGGHKA